MTQRAKVLLIIFLILVVLGGTFIAVYRLYWREKIRSYVLALTTCEYLNEKECLINPKCDPIYNQEEETGRVIKYLKCSAVSDYKKDNLAQAEVLCQETGGKWLKIKSGEYCNCTTSKEKKAWIVGVGCQEMVKN